GGLRVRVLFPASTSGPPAVYSAGQLTAYVPTAVTASRTAATTCLVSWTPASGLPSGLTYDVTDGTGTTVATNVSGTSASVTVPAAAVTPTVKARLGSWVSTNATAAAAACTGYPDAPTGVTVTPSDAQVAVSWTAPAANGGTLASYTVTGTPSDGALGTATCTSTAPTTTCTLTGLTNGGTYAVTITATSDIGTGPASTAVTAIPYPATIMSGANLKLWLDGADAATMLASSGCTGAAATTTVGCWKDKSVTGDDATQPTAAKQPTLSATNLPRAAPRFDATDDQMLLTPSLLPTGTTASTAFHVVQLTDTSPATSGYRTVLGWGTASTNAKRIFAKDTGSAAMFADAHGNGYSSPGSFTPSQTTVAVAEYAASTVRTARDGIAPASGSAAAFSTGTTNAFLGGWSGGSLWQGPIPEVVVLASTLTDSQRRTVEEYLARKWSVTVTPAAPTGVTATASTTTNGAASVAWTAPAWNGGSAITSYTVTATPSDGTLATVTLSCASSPCTLTGLTDGATYAVTVAANNAVGGGPASSPGISLVTYPGAIMSAAALQVWFDGADAATMFASNTCSGAGPTTSIGCWVDKSSGGHDATGSSTSLRPTLTTVNGRSVPGFDGTDDYLGIGTLSTLPAGTSSSTTFLAATMTDPAPASSGYRTALFWGEATTGQGRQLSKTTSSAAAVVDGYGTGTTSPGTWTSSVGILAGEHTSTLVTGWMNGAPGTTSAATSLSTVTARANVGRQSSTNGYYWQGAVPEVVVLNETATSTQRRAVEEYLARKWGGVLTPQAPTGVTATASTTADGAATAAWTAPGWNGGASVSSYTVTATPSDGTLATVTTSCASSPCTVSGLTNGATYSVTVAAVNSAGTGPASSAATVTPYPATVLSGSAVKLWLDGADPATLLASSACTGATATTTVGCWKDKSASGNHVTQATAGYRPALTTVNGRSVPAFDGTDDYLAGNVALVPTGTASSTVAAAAAVNPATAMNGIALLSWGGTTSGSQRKLTSWSATGVDAYYTPQAFATAWPAAQATGVAVAEFATGTSMSVWAQGDTGATGSGAYTTGTDHLWIGSWGTTTPAGRWYGSSSEILVLDTTLTATQRRGVEEYLARKWASVITPQAPTAVSATGGQNAQAPVSWTAPAWNGGAAVTGYTVTASPGGPTCTATAPATTCTVTGLTNGTAYTFTVRATNSVGAGPASAASAAVTPYTVPGAPTSVAAAAGDVSAAVSWSAPASNGGNAITSYTATAVPSDVTLSTRTCSAASSPCTVTGLTNGITYSVTVTATNAAGAGAASSSTTVTPYPAGVMTAAATSLWLDGADTSTLYTSTACTGAAPSGGGAIGCWKDKSTQANHAVQTTAANQPTVGSLNSRNAPLFDGSNDYYPLTVAKLPTGTTSSAVYAVAAQEDTSPGSSDFRHLIGWGANSTGQGRVLEKGSFNSKVYLETFGTWTSATVTKNWPVSTAVLTDGVITSTTVTSTMNASPNYSFAATNNTGTSSGAAVGATGWNTAGVWKGRIAEVVVLASNPTAAENRQVQEYLARKWGLTIAPGLVTGVTATASTTTDAAVDVAWTAPTWNGGASISSYTVTATPSDGTLSTVTTSCASSPCTVTGLVNGATYTVTVAPVNSAGTGVATAAAATVYPYPAAVMTTARLRAWLDGADAATMYASSTCSGATATTTVGCWADKSGQANNAPQSTSGYRPTLTTVNGRSVPGFDGVDDYFPLTVSKLPTGTTSSTMAMTAKLTGTVAYRNLMSWGALTGGQARATYLNTGPVISDTYTAGPTASTSPTNIAQNQQFQLVSAYTSGSSSIALNGVGATTTAGAVSTGSTFALLGGAPGMTYWWQGPIPEVVIFTGALTTAERRLVDEYLARKWGTVITPGIPTGVTVTGADGQASVAWTAPWSGGAAISGYTVTAVPTDGSLGTITTSCASSPCTVTGMTNGATYAFTVTATNSVGVGPASTAVNASAYPVTLFASSALKVWLDAQYDAALSGAADCTGSGASTGSQVGCWKDRSGNGWNAPRITTNGATLTAAAINSRTALRFTKTDPDVYQVTATGIGAVGSANRTVFAVAAARTTYGTAGTNSAGAVAMFNGGWNTGIFAKAYSGTTTTVDGYQSDGYDTAINGLYGSAAATTSPVIASSVSSSSGGTLTNGLALNGTGTLSSMSRVASWQTVGDSFIVGGTDTVASNDYAYPLDGDVGEVLVFNRALSSSERRTVEEYLARHWGQTIAPAAPVTPSATSGGTTSSTASWSAPTWNGGAAVTSYTATATASGQTTRTCTTSGTSCNLTGLTDNVTYTVSVTATNTTGTGPAATTTATP
ncbi:MAG: fibronectin type III domain-containing protein, partial [Actinobacteria bacterium]|nr:fibronectin type III domain-containing protein [Actinomycetota bacterium]